MMRCSPCQTAAGELDARRFVPAVVLLVALFVTSACGPRVASPAPAEDESQTLIVELPAIYLNVAQDGAITLAEGPLHDVLGSLGVDLSGLSMSAETVQKFVGANIQHIQLDNRRDGLYIYINGQPYPTLVWDEAALASLVDVLAMFGTDLGEAGKLLTLLPDLGIGVVVNFPVAAGSAATRLAPMAPNTAAGAQVTLEDAMNAPVALDLTLTYAEDGSFQLQGLNPFMLGMIPQDAMRQSPEAIANLTEQGIHSLSIAARSTGLLIMVNGQPLPLLRTTSDQQLLQLIQLALQLQGDSSSTAQIAGVIQQLLPPWLRQGLRLTVNFPGA
jgi:hypothetical protein